MRKSLGFQGSDLVIGFSGRLDPVKNLDLLWMFSSIATRVSTFRLLVVGDGPERHVWKPSPESGFHPYVKFVGDRPSATVFASDGRVPINVLTRANAVNRFGGYGGRAPVITTRVGELPYIS